MVHHDNETVLDFLADEIKKTIEGYEMFMEQADPERKIMWEAAIFASNHILDMIDIIQTR